MAKAKPSIRQEKAARLEAEAKRLRREEAAFWSEVSDRLSEICQTYRADIIRILGQTTAAEPSDQDMLTPDQYGGAEAEDPYEIRDLATDGEDTESVR